MILKLLSNKSNLSYIGYFRQRAINLTMEIQREVNRQLKHHENLSITHPEQKLIVPLPNQSRSIHTDQRSNISLRLLINDTQTINNNVFSFWPRRETSRQVASMLRQHFAPLFLVWCSCICFIGLFCSGRKALIAFLIITSFELFIHYDVISRNRLYIYNAGPTNSSSLSIF